MSRLRPHKGQIKQKLEKKFSIIELHEAHQKIWGELAVSGTRKSSLSNRGEYYNDCPACHYICHNGLRCSEDCMYCANTSEKGYVGCMYEGHPYNTWDKSRTSEDRKRLAKVVQDLPLAPKFQKMYDKEMEEICKKG